MFCKMIIFFFKKWKEMKFKERYSKIKKMDFALKENDLNELINFEKVEMWTQAIDFTFQEEDEEGFVLNSIFIIYCFYIFFKF